jgi:hypothetical protein
MASRVNRAIELLQQNQAIYYAGGHSGHVLTYPQGREDAHVWADNITVGMEHGAFDMAGLAEYMRGLVDSGPTRSGHRTPSVIVGRPSMVPTLPMFVSTPGSSARSSGAACTGCCCAKPSRRTRYAPLSNAAAIRIIRPVSILPCLPRSSACRGPSARRAAAVSA